MPLGTEELTRMRGAEVHGSDGEKIGKIDEIYLDQQTGKPEWLAVKTGLFGGNVSFVPLADATTEGDTVRVPYDKATIKDAPNVDPGHELSQEEEARLYRHYGFEYGEDRSDSGLPEGRTDTGTHERGAVGHDTSGPTTDSAMTRSEEELRVGTVQEEAGRARLRKWVETEQVTQTVPVQREEIRIEREPITDGNVGEALDGPAISEEEHEVVLHEERPVVEKNVVPKERVRLDKETHTEEATVSEDLRKEQIEVDGEGTR